MKSLFLKSWDRLRYSFWFVPAAMSCLAALLALGAVGLDRAVAKDGWLHQLDWIYSGGAEGASLLLGTVAGSMIAIAGTVFSMTLVVLSFASSQLGPRLLRNFMRDTANQVVLGTFVATFVYCLLVLRTIRRASEIGFVPHLSVSLGMLLAMVSIGVLIYFIDHVSVSIQADEVVARVCNELEDGIDRLYPSYLGTPESEASQQLETTELPAAFASQARPVGALKDGYLQRIDADTLMAIAQSQDLLIQLERRPGHYVIKDQAIVLVYPGDQITAELIEEISSAFVLGTQRTAAQDIEFSFNQLVEIALRALSPGINDPFTAVACIDRIGSALCRVAQRDMPSAHRFDPLGELRLVAPGSSFSGIVDTALNQIRQSARANPAVAIRMLETIGKVAKHVKGEAEIASLQRQAIMIVRGARDAVPEEYDRLEVEIAFIEATHALGS